MHFFSVGISLGSLQEQPVQAAADGKGAPHRPQVRGAGPPVIRADPQARDSGHGAREPQVFAGGLAASVRWSKLQFAS